MQDMKNGSSAPSCFAPARLEDDTTVEAQALLAAEYADKVLDLVQTPVMILNDCRQVIYANQAFVALAGAEDKKDVVGRRPGAILGCVHAAGGESVCGTTDFCRYCGAVKAIMSSLSGHGETRHCRILRSGGRWEEALDLLTSAVPLDVTLERFSVFSITDVSHEYRLRALERIFYHDVQNRVAALRLMALMLGDGDIEPVSGAGMLLDAVDEIRDVIGIQSDFAAAESGSLAPQIVPTEAAALLEKVRDLWAERGPAVHRSLVLGDVCHCVFETDPALAGRVLGVFVENALEAVGAGGTVTLSCFEERGGILFSVQNPGIMDEAVRLQVFKRTFSTKSRSRGFGTYAAKLFAERYLGGEVRFHSGEPKGTVFSLWLPSVSG